MHPRSRSWFYVVAVIGFMASADPLPAASRTELSRQEIRALPIESRPYRPGHFYGNTVRRNLHRRGS